MINLGPRRERSGKPEKYRSIAAVEGDSKRAAGTSQEEAAGYNGWNGRGDAKGRLQAIQPELAMIPRRQSWNCFRPCSIGN